MKLHKLRWSDDRISLLWPDHPLLMAGDKYLEITVDLLCKKESSKSISIELSKISKFSIQDTTEFVNQVKNALEESGVIQEKHTDTISEPIPTHLHLAMATFNLTRKCNLKCNHCYAGGSSESHNSELFRNWLTNFQV